jgi:flagellar biogenesis protein FliO
MMRLKDRRARTLRLGETLQLGDRRFVAVIEFEKARFLLGGTHTSLALLARLDREIAAIPSVDAMDAAPKKADASNEPKEERD